MMDRWAPIIDGWLESDRMAPRKQRHTARRVWESLVDEHGAQVAERTVRGYVAAARRRLGVDRVEVMVPQQHPLGAEAEVDFGEITVILDGAGRDQEPRCRSRESGRPCRKCAPRRRHGL